ncbi:MAG TPA: hypothetical protein VJ742_03060 [Nitrososphaera sp.]|nr:hypothetical protein [Nitrososphaera sp.]
MPEVAQREEILSEGNDFKEKSVSLLADIDSLIDQTLQIYELTSKEGEIIESIGSSISILLTTLKLSLSLPQNIFQNDFPAIKSAVLNGNAEIIIMQANGNIVTKKFAELDSSQVVNVIKEIIPKLSKSADEKKTDVTEKIVLLKKVAKQFQRVKAMDDQAKEEE